jgi:hypothetical protein
MSLLTVRKLREYLEQLREQDAEVRIEDHTGRFELTDEPGPFRRLYLSKTLWHAEENFYSLRIDGDADELIQGTATKRADGAPAT